MSSKKKWTETDMENAMKAVKEGSSSVRNAAKTFGMKESKEQSLLPGSQERCHRKSFCNP